MGAFRWMVLILVTLTVSCSAESSGSTPAQQVGERVNLATLWYTWFGFDLA